MTGFPKMTAEQRDTFDTLPRNGGWIESTPDRSQNFAELGAAFPDLVTTGWTGGHNWRLTDEGIQVGMALRWKDET